MGYVWKNFDWKKVQKQLLVKKNRLFSKYLCSVAKIVPVVIPWEIISV